MIIWLSGPTGAGKTSFARLLRTKGYSIVEESIPTDLFRAFAAEPVENCESLQAQLMQARLNGWRDVAGAPRIAFDRCIDEDIEVFCRMHRKAGLLTERQFNRLEQLGRALESEIPNPDLILFFKSAPDVLLQRIQNACRPSTTIKNLELQVSLYSEWLRHRREEILQVDTTRFSEPAMTKLLWEI